MSMNHTMSCECCHNRFYNRINANCLVMGTYYPRNSSDFMKWLKVRILDLQHVYYFVEDGAEDTDHTTYIKLSNRSVARAIYNRACEQPGSVCVIDFPHGHYLIEVPSNDDTEEQSIQSTQSGQSAQSYIETRPTVD
jgi:hypothetical protein